MKIRSATLEDIDALEVMEQGVVTAERPYNPVIRENNVRYYDIKQLIESELSELVVAEQDDEIIACGYVQIRQSKPQHSHDKHGYLGFMFVAESF